MDRNGNNLSGSASAISFPLYLNPNLIENLRVTDDKFFDAQSSFSNSNAYAEKSEAESPEELDFSDEILSYINHILMEEDVEDKACMFQESTALQAAEKSFYDVLVQKQQKPPCIVPDSNPEKESSISYLEPRVSVPKNWAVVDSVNGLSQMTCRSSYSSSSSISSGGSVIDGPVDSLSPVSTLKVVPDIFSDSHSAMLFNQGVEEASKFLPNGSSIDLLVDLSCNGSSVKTHKVEPRSDHRHNSLSKVNNKKSHYLDDPHEGRSSKQSAVYSESTAVSPDLFDKVLLCSKGKNEGELRRELSLAAAKAEPAELPDKPGGGKKTRGKKNVVDMRTLLTLCAQAVASDDRRTANEFLKQIRQHSSPTGDGMQRLGHYFACGLEARMAGSATEVYRSLINLPTSAADILKAYQLHLATCPFRKISNFFANRTIMNVAEKARSLHIVDFGIYYGFQWPVFLQHLSARPGGPPSLRITGIDLPCPGFRPAARVEETGRRLARYAEKFNVPFKFQAIAQRWDTVRLEDLRIEEGEMVVVNSLFRLKNLLDETVMANSPRDAVLGLVRRMNPSVFVLGITNGSYNAPFFITRFREALFHYSSFFDMLDAVIPREIHERVLYERTIVGREAMNVIACEAAERIERPETYKQWQQRNIRAGFKQLPINEDIVERSRQRYRLSYHKDFVIDRDGKWLLQGWKGRILYALSAWKPAS